MVVIGLSGYARSGKDTVADHLVAKHGFDRIGFADALKEAVYVLNPCLADGRRVKDIVDQQGWEGAKATGIEVRRLLQFMGTEVARNLWDSDFWVNLVAKRIREARSDHWVITDCRFPNEALYVERVGVLWRIVRPGTEPVNAHSSETSLDGWDFDDHLFNDGTIPDLYERVDNLLERTLYA